MAFSRTIDSIVQGVETVIVAPPGYGKRKFILRNRHHEPFNDYFDTESLLRSRPNHWYGIISECACLIPKANLSFMFLPARENFIAGCVAAGVEDPDLMYEDYIKHSRSATYVITSGDSLLFYQRFLEKAINHYFDGEPLIPVPTFRQGYKADPAYSDISIVPLSSSVPTSAIADLPSCSSISSLKSPTIADSSLDLEVEPRNLPHSSPSSILEVCREYVKCSGKNVDLEILDNIPDALHQDISKLFVKMFDITVVPVTIGFSTSRGTVCLEYFGGNFVKIGPIYMSLLVMCKKRFDTGTVQFSPPDWLIPSHQ